MSKSIGLPVVGATLLIFVALANASDHSNLGMYTPSVSEGRLFTNNGIILRSDLQFSAPGLDSVVARKGSELEQTIPPVVWQYSGLLPVSDYLKTAVIHSYSSNEKIRPWQEVQSTFYTGLRVEGAVDGDAKIAFAGAYAFSPRWSLVQFTEVEEEIIVYPDTILYDVEYIHPLKQGMSLEEYRSLALKILQDPDSVSLENIRGVIDAADAAKENAKEEKVSDSAGAGNNTIANADQSNSDEEVEADAKAQDTQTEDDEGTVKSGSGAPLKSSGNVNINISGKINNATIAGAETSAIAQLTQPALLPVEVSIPVEVAIPVEVVVDQSIEGTATWAATDLKDFVLITASEAPKKQSVPKPKLLLPEGRPIDEPEGREDNWVLLPDGTLVLEDVERLLLLK